MLNTALEVYVKDPPLINLEIINGFNRSRIMDEGTKHTTGIINERTMENISERFIEVDPFSRLVNIKSSEKSSTESTAPRVERKIICSPSHRR
jgi:hypothetical protein